jgi:hypothetical protein
MKSLNGMRAAAVIAAVLGVNVNLVPASAAPPPPPPANGRGTTTPQRVIEAPAAPQRVIEVPAPRHRRPLDVDVRLIGGDGRLVYPGQEVGFTFRVNRDAYVVIYDIDTEGRTHLLYPRNRWDPEFVRGNTTHFLPGRGSDYRLVADGPAGEEFVVAVASDHPIADNWVDCWDGLAGRTEYDHLGSTSERVGYVRGDRFQAMDRVATRLIEVPVEPVWSETARDYTSFYVGDPRYRHDRSRGGNGNGKWRGRRGR